jgi:hypothetical protein
VRPLDIARLLELLDVAPDGRLRNAQFASQRFQIAHAALEKNFAKPGLSFCDEHMPGL